ncbi:unnamed protein product [Moneuplotes crassus]|uniref:Ankyrin repeat domain-containing protein n=1 Tax=Euplotes crassus TaxID=5936 RepID=A0AAD1U1Z5_EUPCR|nr:unnamed protein product [Moneuplotes crassus]
MESISASSSDGESLYESTLEQVVAFDKKKNKVYKSKSQNSSKRQRKNRKLKRNSRKNFNSDEEYYSDRNDSDEDTNEHHNEKFSAINCHKSIAPYTRKITGGNNKPKENASHMEYSSDSSDNEEDTSRNSGALVTSEGNTNKINIKKYQVEEAMIQNSVMRESHRKKMQRKSRKARQGMKGHSRLEPTKKRKYNFTFSSDDEEEEKQGKIKQRDESILEIDSYENHELTQDSSTGKIFKRNLSLLVFRKDFDGISQQYEHGFITQKDLIKKDHRGNNPLHLAAKLSKLDEEYLLITEYLLEIGGNHKEKDSDGWEMTDEAINNSNIRLLEIIYDFCVKRKKSQIAERQQIINNLKSIPDFYMELKWEFNSTVIPFFSKFTPKDTYKIWKYGSSLRLDFTLVGIEKLKGKRRDMSIIFRDAPSADDPYKDCYVLLLNKDKGIVVDPIEDQDYEEKVAVLQDIMNSESVKADIEMSNLEFRPVTNMWGSQKTSKLNGSKCSEFKLAFESKKRLENKGTDIFQWIEDEYFDTKITQEDHVNRVLQQNPDLEIREPKVQNKTEKRSAYFWLDPNFDLTSRQFFSILETLQNGGSIGIQKLYDFLQHEEINTSLQENGFPVKISIPFGYTINAKMSLNNFEFIEQDATSQPHLLPDGCEDISEVFKISDDLVKVSRKEGMKTMKNKSKRLAFAGFIYS